MGGIAMATFVVLGCFTDQGIRSVKDTAKRAEAFKEMARKMGVTVKDVYWTLGQFDIVAVCDAPDDATASALAFSVGAQGNVRTQTLPAISQAEIGTVLSKVA
jgi:uncharacterized protein with GYD domain